MVYLVVDKEPSYDIWIIVSRVQGIFIFFQDFLELAIHELTQENGGMFKAETTLRVECQH